MPATVEDPASRIDSMPQKLITSQGVCQLISSGRIIKKNVYIIGDVWCILLVSHSMTSSMVLGMIGARKPTLQYRQFLSEGTIKTGGL